MIRAVFFDLDGTLLDSKKRIPASAKRAAGFVTRANDEDGIAYALEHLLNQ